MIQWRENGGENWWWVFKSREVVLTNISSIHRGGKAEYTGTLARRYCGSMWKCSSGCFCLLLSYFMSQEAERRCGRGWRFEKRGGMAESPNRVGEWVEGKPTGELSGSTEDPHEVRVNDFQMGDPHSHGLVFFSRQFSCMDARLTWLGRGGGGGLPREYRYLILYLQFWSVKSSENSVCCFCLLVGLFGLFVFSKFGKLLWWQHLTWSYYKLVRL